MRCLCSSYAGRRRHALEPPAWLLALTKYKDAVLPYRPYWPALLFNTFLYAALWALLLVAPWTTRRTYRRLRRRCPNCGYDIRHCEDPGCPECGWGRQMPDSTDSDETPPATMPP